jgi:ribosome-binding factor A
LNSLLDDEISDPRLEGVRITRVELTRDGSSARVWFSVRHPTRDVSLDAVTTAFEHAAGFIRLRLSDALPLKRSPELRFKHDPAALLGADRDENR